MSKNNNYGLDQYGARPFENSNLEQLALNGLSQTSWLLGVLALLVSVQCPLCRVYEIFFFVRCTYVGMIVVCTYSTCVSLHHVCFQLFSKLQATKQEIIDLQDANARERQELEQTQNELTRELKLKLASYLLLFL